MQKLQNILVIVGPPRAGKDTLANNILFSQAPYQRAVSSAHLMIARWSERNPGLDWDTYKQTPAGRRELQDLGASLPLSVFTTELHEMLIRGDVNSAIMVGCRRREEVDYWRSVSERCTVVRIESSLQSASAMAHPIEQDDMGEDVLLRIRCNDYKELLQHIAAIIGA